MVGRESFATGTRRALLEFGIPGHGYLRARVSARSDSGRSRGHGSRLGSSEYDLEQHGGVPFRGDWGSGDYVLGIRSTSDQVTDPRGRSEYRNPFTILNR